jgi:hypothetical protein
MSFVPDKCSSLKSKIGTHCDHWYEGEGCHYCKVPAWVDDPKEDDLDSIESSHWQAEPPEEDGWYVVGWTPDPGRPAYACIKVVGNPPRSPYADYVRWLVPALNLPPLPGQEN